MIRGMLIALLLLVPMAPAPAQAQVSGSGTIRYQIFQSGSEYTAAAWADNLGKGPGYFRAFPDTASRIDWYSGDFRVKTVYCNGKTVCSGTLIRSGVNCRIITARFYLRSSTGSQVYGARLNSCPS